MTKIALGRGLGSLIPQKAVVQNEKIHPNPPLQKEGGVANFPPLQRGTKGDFIGNIESMINNIEIDKISKNPVQMRKVFAKESLKELADSIKLHGILEPVLVTELGRGAYELIAGERRMEAAKIAGLKKIPAIIRKVSRQEKLEFALIENIQRENLNPIEEAKAYKMLSSDFALTQEEIAARSGKSRSRVANFLRLLSLPLEIQNAIGENKISEGHGRAILSLQNPEKQRALFNEILKSNLTVRQAEEKVKLVSVASHTRKIGGKKSPWKETEDALGDFLSAKVAIKKAGNGAKIIIECYAQNDLDNVVARILKK